MSLTIKLEHVFNVTIQRSKVAFATILTESIDLIWVIFAILYILLKYLQCSRRILKISEASLLLSTEFRFAPQTEIEYATLPIMKVLEFLRNNWSD